jgi:hypothetical protein
MHIRKLLIPAAAALLCIALAAAPALAKKGGEGNGHGKSAGHIFWDDGKDARTAGGAKSDGKIGVWVGEKDRDVLREYVLGHYAKNCPPGLAKKNPPCIPPGQAKKFAAGSYLPKDIGFSIVPGSIVTRLTPPPPGGMYVRVDRDVYLIDQATRKILDAVLLFSAVN